MTDSDPTSLVPIGPTDLTTVHTHAVTQLEASYTTALEIAQHAHTDAVRAADAARAAVAVAEDEVQRDYVNQLGRLDTPTTTTEDGHPCCPCGTPLSRPGYCSEKCAEAAALTEVRNAEVVKGGTAGGWQIERVIVTHADQRLVASAQAEADHYERLAEAARQRSAHLEAGRALLRQGLDRAALHAEVATRETAYWAAMKYRSAIWQATVERAERTYILHGLDPDERHTIIRQELGADYVAADAAMIAAEAAFAAASALWGAILQRECALRGVSPRPRLCTYCELIPVTDLSRIYCSDDCERAGKRDGLNEPVPGVRQCESCLRWYRNPAAPDCPYCSDQCVLSQPIDVQPYLAVDFTQVLIVTVPKSAAERRRFGRELKRREAARGPRGSAPGRVLPETTATAEERAETGLLARLRAASEPLREDALVERLGVRPYTARRVLGRLVASGRVTRLGAGTRGNPYRYALPR